MFLLTRPDLPREPDALARALEDGLRVFVSRSGPMVTVQGNDVRALDALSVDLSGAKVEWLQASARRRLSRAVLHLSGTIAVSDELVATVWNLRCTGDGASATLACAAITPQFARVEQRPFPLSALPLGEVRLHDVAFALAKDRI